MPEQKNPGNPAEPRGVVPYNPGLYALDIPAANAGARTSCPLWAWDSRLSRKLKQAPERKTAQSGPEARAPGAGDYEALLLGDSGLVFGCGWRTLAVDAVHS